MARTIDEVVRSPRLARSFIAGYRPPASGLDALTEGEALIVVPDAVMCFGTGGGTFIVFDLGASAGPAAPLSGMATTGIGGHGAVRAVSGGLAVASSSDMTHFGAVVGVTLGFAAAGTPCAYVAAGPVVEPSWSWAPGPVLLGTDGTLTQREPSAGFVQQIGVSDAPTRLIVGIEPPFSLGA